MNDIPKNVYDAELLASMADGADLMASMIRISVFQGNEMPPPDIFNWYVENLAYRCVAEEYALVYKQPGHSQEAFDATQAELAAVRSLIEKNKQFSLQAKIDNIFKTRMLHLPT